MQHDKDDWTLRDKWIEGENNLFDTIYKTDCYPSSAFSIVAYPNPTPGEFQLIFSKTLYTIVDIRLVDAECNVLVSRTGINSNSIGLHSGNLKKNGIIRLYYKFIEDGCEYQGHGDIQIEKQPG